MPPEMMSSVWIGTTCFGAIVTALIVYWLIQKWKNTYPPGPPALPLIGNLLRKHLIYNLVKFVMFCSNIYQVFSFVIFLPFSVYFHFSDCSTLKLVKCFSECIFDGFDTRKTLNNEVRTL
jgi:hypothetical protein